MKIKLTHAFGRVAIIWATGNGLREPDFNGGQPWPFCGSSTKVKSLVLSGSTATCRLVGPVVLDILEIVLNERGRNLVQCNAEGKNKFKFQVTQVLDDRHT